MNPSLVGALKTVQHDEIQLWLRENKEEVIKTILGGDNTLNVEILQSQIEVPFMERGFHKATMDSIIDYAIDGVKYVLLSEIKPTLGFPSSSGIIAQVKIYKEYLLERYYDHKRRKKLAEEIETAILTYTKEKTYDQLYTDEGIHIYRVPK